MTRHSCWRRKCRPQISITNVPSNSDGQFSPSHVSTEQTFSRASFEGRLACGFSNRVGRGPELGFGFEESDDRRGGDAEEFGDIADVGFAGVEQVEGEGCGARVVLVVMGDGQSPELDDLAEPGWRLPATGVD